MARHTKPEQFGTELDAQLCFDLYAASRAVTNAYRPLLAGLGLTYPQYLVMLVLWQRGTRTVRELGEDLQLDSGTLSPLLKRLAAAGLVSRQRQAADERTVEIALTDEGRALQQQARTVPAAIGAAMGLTRTEFAQLKATLRRLVDNVSTSELVAPAVSTARRARVPASARGRRAI